MFAWKKHNPYVRTYHYTAEECLETLEVMRQHFQTIDHIIITIHEEHQRFRLEDE